MILFRILISMMHPVSFVKRIQVISDLRLKSLASN